MADGVDLTDVNDPDQAGAQARADETWLQQAQRWVDELAKENLGPETTAKLKQAARNLGDKANQQFVAGLKRSQEAAQDVARAVNRFVRKPAPTGDGEAAPAGVKKSEDNSGARQAIGRAVTDVLGEDHPAMTDPKLLNRLADGLRPFIKEVADGKVFSSFDKLDQLTALYDVAGEQTTALLDAVHGAVRPSNAPVSRARRWVARWAAWVRWATWLTSTPAPWPPLLGARSRRRS